MSAYNPYTPPKAPLETVAEGAARIEEMPRFSAWWVLLLEIVTFGLYVPYWLFTRSRRLNKVWPGAIDGFLVWTALAVIGASYLGSLGEILEPDNRGMHVLSKALGFGQFVAVLIWVYTLRNRLNRIIGAQEEDERWIGPVATFFFQILYLQYKVNQAIDARRAPAAAPAQSVP
jgi:hypothetical protein